LRSIKTKKYGDYILFKRALEIVKEKKHLTMEGLREIVAIKSTLNLAISDQLKLAFLNITPVIRPDN
jgi:hypothetical protein